MSSNDCNDLLKNLNVPAMLVEIVRKFSKSMDTPLADSMNWVTRRRFTQKRFRYGKEAPYQPHTRLVKNLEAKFGLPQEEIRARLHKERNYLISQGF